MNMRARAWEHKLATLETSFVLRLFGKQQCRREWLRYVLNDKTARP